MLWNYVIMKDSKSISYKWKESKLNITLIESPNLSSSHWSKSKWQKQKNKTKMERNLPAGQIVIAGVLTRWWEHEGALSRGLCLKSLGSTFWESWKWA